MSRCRVRLLALALLITPCWLLSLVATPAHAQGAQQTSGEPQVGAVEAIVVEYPSGRVIYQKASHDRMPPASLTKILTAILAIEYGKLDDVITVVPEDLAGDPELEGRHVVSAEDRDGAASDDVHGTSVAGN